MRSLVISTQNVAELLVFFRFDGIGELTQGINNAHT